VTQHNKSGTIYGENKSCNLVVYVNRQTVNQELRLSTSEWAHSQPQYSGGKIIGGRNNVQFIKSVIVEHTDG